MTNEMNPSDDTPLQGIEAAVDRAILEDYPEHGALEFEHLIREGYRSQITDHLIARLERETQPNMTSQLLGLLWAIQGTSGIGAPNGIRPKATIGNPDEPISPEQYARIVRSAERENAPDQLWSYIALFGCISHFDLLDRAHRELMRNICKQATGIKGYGGVSDRAKRVIEQLDRYNDQ